MNIIPWVALGISLISLFISWRNLHQTKRINKSELQRDLLNRQIKINESIIDHDIPGPYIHHLKISKLEMKEFSAKCLCLFNHINLLQDVYLNREILGDKSINKYGQWASTIVRPWIESDEDLKRIWFLAKNSKDMLGEEFIDWLIPLWPIVEIKE